MRFLPATHVPEGQSILAVSTEDGRILFYDTRRIDFPEAGQKQAYASCQAIAQMGGVTSGFIGRIKEFEILPVARLGASPDSPLLIITGSSDGAVRVWKFTSSELPQANAESEKGEVPQVGSLLGTHESGHRITCLTAFVMDGPSEEGPDEDDEEVMEIEEEEDEESDSDSE